MKVSTIRNPKSEIRNGGHGSNKAVFLDRDGVLIACVVRNGRPYPPLTLEQVEILPGVAGAVRQLAATEARMVSGWRCTSLPAPTSASRVSPPAGSSEPGVPIDSVTKPRFTSCRP